MQSITSEEITYAWQFSFAGGWSVFCYVSTDYTEIFTKKIHKKVKNAIAKKNWQNQKNNHKLFPILFLPDITVWDV